jgi:hypothetical protein
MVKRFYLGLGCALAAAAAASAPARKVTVVRADARTGKLVRSVVVTPRAVQARPVNAAAPKTKPEHTAATPLETADRFKQFETLAALRSMAPVEQRLLLACHLGDGDEARAIVREHPGIVERLSDSDRRALTNEAWAPNAPAVRLLLELGFDPSLPALTGPTGGNALHCAAWEGSVECVAALLEYASGRALIHSRENTYGGTPLSWCCHGSRNCSRAGANHAEVTRLLLAAGARPNVELTACADEMQAVLDSSTAGSDT